MSVTIKGMWLPDQCGNCPLYSNIDNVCQYDNTDTKYDDMPYWCPLEENRDIDRKDFYLALAGWYYAMDSEWCGDGSPWDIIQPLLDKYHINKQDVLASAPKDWIN